VRGFMFGENDGENIGVSIQPAENNGSLVIGYKCVFCWLISFIQMLIMFYFCYGRV